VEGSHEGTPLEWALHKHVNIVRHVGHTSGVTLSLPETGLEVLPVALASLDRQLVEGCEDGDRHDCSFSLPEGLLGHVEILSDGVGASVPPSDFFGEAEVEGIVRKGVGDVEDGEGVIAVHAAVNLIVGPGEDGDIEVVAGEDLVGLVDVFLSFGEVLGLGEVVVDLANVYFGNPGVGVDDRQQDLVGVDS
jgi:hypothetical protein